MSLKVYQGSNQAPLEPLLSRRVAVIGYGNQGRAHAANLRDSQVDVIIGADAETAGFNRAIADGFEPVQIARATSQSDLIIIALPDEVQREVYCRDIAANLQPNTVLGFIHGFAIHYQLIKPQHDIGVVLVAPKGPGTTLRQRYLDGLGLPCLLAVHQESPDKKAKDFALAWASALGCARAGIVATTFADETETDLFGEQAVLCGGMTQLMLAAFETLVEAGYAPELAYLECCQEVKQVADLVYERGLAAMMDAISNTAEFGAAVSGPKLIDDDVRGRMKSILQDIRNGDFAQTMSDDLAANRPRLTKYRSYLTKHRIEKAGKAVRELFPSLSNTEVQNHL